MFPGSAEGFPRHLSGCRDAKQFQDFETFLRPPNPMFTMVNHHFTCRNGKNSAVLGEDADSSDSP